MPRYLNFGAAGEVKTPVFPMGKLNTNLTNIPPMEAHRKKLRNNPTPAEDLLWKWLRRKQLLGKKFRRQFSVGHYILDFYCVECCLAVELDGAGHFEPGRKEYDAERTAYLASMGVRVLRFENQLLFQGLDLVLEVIREAVRGNRS